MNIIEGSLECKWSSKKKKTMIFSAVMQKNGKNTSETVHPGAIPVQPRIGPALLSISFNFIFNILSYEDIYI